jgi:excisionase family DNA binding protein
MHQPLVYSVPDAVKAAGIGRTSVYQAIAAGELKAVKHGRRTLILADDLRAYLAALPAMKPAKVG